MEKKNSLRHRMRMRNTNTNTYTNTIISRETLFNLFMNPKNKDLIKFIKKNQESINKKMNSKDTPLMYALSFNQSVSVLKLMIKMILIKKIKRKTEIILYCML